MRKLLIRFSDMKIHNKLLLSYIIVVFLPVLMVGLILTQDIRNKVMDSAMKEAEGSLERIKKRVTQELNACITVSDLFYGDKLLHQIISKEYNSLFDVFISYKEYNKFKEYMEVYNKLYDIRVYTRNKTILDNWQFMRATDEIREKEWYKNAVKANGRISWEYTAIPNNVFDKNPYLTLTRSIKVEGKDLEAVLTICMDNRSTLSIVEQETFDTIILNQDGIVIAAKDRNLLGNPISETPLGNVTLKETDYYDMRYNGMLYRVLFSTFSIPKSNGVFTILSLVPSESITRDAREAIKTGVLIMGASLVIAFMLIIMFSRAFSSRISKIGSIMHSVALGDFSMDSPIKGKDEIGQLWRDLYKMVDGIKNLMEEIKTANQQKHQLLVRQKDIKFRMLVNQVNPHFLFNSLETIRMRAHVKGDKEVSLAIRRLGMIIRKSLEMGSKPILLRNELELVQDYLELQKFKYGDRISFSINVEEDRLNNYSILPFIIQPLVENAVVHGLGDRRGEGNISITVRDDGDNIIIMVEDDGKGIEEEKLKSIIESFEDYEEKDEQRIGLRNVHQRIRLFYGLGYGIRVNSEVNLGTRVIIILPKGDEGHV